MRKVTRLVKKLKINDHVLLFKLVLSLMLPSMAILIIISAFFTINYSRQSMKDIASNTYVMLQNVIKSLDYIVESAKQTTFQIYKSPSIYPLISQKFSNEDKLKVYSYLNNILSANSNIYSVYIMKDGKSLIRTGGSSLYDESDASIQSFIQNNPVLSAVPRTITSNTGSLKLITVFYTDVNLRRDNYYVVVNVSQSRNSILQSLYLQEGQKLLVTNKFGQVLSHSDSTLFAHNISNEDFYTSSDKTLVNGTSSVMVNQRKGIVSYVTSDNGNYFGFLISDYNNFYANTTKTTNFILLFSFILFVLLVVASVYISQRIYSPINSIFTNIKDLIKKNTPGDINIAGDLRHDAKAIAKVIEVLNNQELSGSDHNRNTKNNFMFRLLSGRRGMTQNEFSQGMELFLHLSSRVCKMYQIVVLRIDNYNDFVASNTPESIDFQLGYIEDISSDIFGKKHVCQSFANDTEQVVILIGMENTDSEMTVHSIENSKIQDTVRQLFNLSMTIGVSNPSHSLTIESVREMFEEARSSTNYRVLHGRGKIYSKESLNIKIGKCEKSSELAALVISSVKNDTPEQFNDNIHWLFSSISPYSYESIIEILIQIYSLFLKTIDEFQPHSRHMEELSIEQVRQMIMEFEDYDQIKQLFFNQYSKIQEVRAVLTNSNTLTLVDESISYINAYFNDPNMSASGIAERLGITPQYFSKLFKQTTSMSFPDYLSDIRLEYAKKLLIENPLTTAYAICEKIGYNSASYFSSSFTKKYGIPPSKFILLTKQNQT